MIQYIGYQSFSIIGLMAGLNNGYKMLAIISPPTPWIIFAGMLAAAPASV